MQTLIWIKKPKKPIFKAETSAQGIIFSWSIYDYSQKQGQAASRLFKVYATFGERVYEKHVSSREEAEDYCNKETLKLQQAQFGIKYVQTCLTELEVKEAELAYQKIRDMNSTLSVIVDEWKEIQSKLKPVSISEAVKEFISSNINEANLRKKTTDERNNTLNRLAKKHESKLVHQIKAEDYRAQIREIVKTVPEMITRRNRRSVFSAFLNWCKTRKYIIHNELDEIPSPKIDTKTPVILTVEESRRLLRAAEKIKDGILVPYTALALFGGFRDGEIKRLSWKDIDLENKSIMVKADVSKTRAARSHILTDNLIEILKFYQDLKLYPKNFTKLWTKVRKEAGLSSSDENNDIQWIEDTTRKSAISYWLKIHKNPNEAAYRFGNSDDIISKHYEHFVPIEQTAIDYYNISIKILEDMRKPEIVVENNVGPEEYIERLG